MSTTPASPGCLSDAQILELQQAAPGGVPEELARHLAGCDACQQRALFGAERRPARGGPRRSFEVPSPGRALFLAAAVLIALGLFFYSLLRLTGRIE
jgi:hypothetical protein